MAFKFEWNDVKFSKGVQAKSAEALEATFRNIEADAFANTAYLTGRLRNSVGYVIQPRGFYFRGIIGYGGNPDRPDPTNDSGVRYAVYYEYGTSMMSPRYTMTTAYFNHIMDFKSYSGWDF